MCAYKRISPQPVIEGGTGIITATTAYAPICAGTTATGAFQAASTGLSTSGYVLTSTGASSLPTFQAAAGGGITTIDGDTGSVTGTTVSIKAGGSAQAGASINFAGSGTALTFNVTDANKNTFMGLISGVNATGAVYCTGFGWGTLNSIASPSANNVAVGAYSCHALSDGTANCGVGSNTLQQLTTGSYNLALGQTAGFNYTGSETSNILLNNQGTLSESNVLRIGAGTGTGSLQLNSAFISGIRGITSATADQVLTVNSSNQIASIGAGTSGQVLTSNGSGAAPSFQAAGGASPVAFTAYLSAAIINATGDGTVATMICDTVLANHGSGYNNGTGAFTAPSTGTYFFTASSQCSPIGSSTLSYMELVATSYTYVGNLVNAATVQVATDLGMQVSAVVAMTAGDTCYATVVYSGSTKTVDIGGGNSFFGGYLIH